MKVLIVIAHSDPNKEATAYRIAKAAEEALTAAGNEVKTTDLLSEGFDKVATIDDFKVVKDGGKHFAYLANQQESNLKEPVLRQHELVKWCTHILIVGPMYYFRYPACFYAWVERTFTSEFSFPDDGSHPVGNKKVSCIITTGAGPTDFTVNGDGPVDIFLYGTTFAFKYLGMQVTRTIGYWAANAPETIAKEGEWMAKFKKAIVKLDSFPLLPVGAADGKTECQRFAETEPLTLDEILKE